MPLLQCTVRAQEPSQSHAPQEAENMLGTVTLAKYCELARAWLIELPEMKSDRPLSVCTTWTVIVDGNLGDLDTHKKSQNKFFLWFELNSGDLHDNFITLHDCFSAYWCIQLYSGIRQLCFNNTLKAGGRPAVKEVHARRISVSNIYKLTFKFTHNHFSSHWCG